MVAPARGRGFLIPLWDLPLRKLIFHKSKSTASH